MKKRIISAVLVIAMLISMVPMLVTRTSAATTLNYAPYANVEYGYSETVVCGTIRYIRQSVNQTYFYKDYWPAAPFGQYEGPGSECGTACISMALSYVGINKTPKEILNAHNGVTYFDGWGATYLTPSFATGISNYLNGNGKYSPVIIHLNYGEKIETNDRGHFIMIVGKVSDNVWQIMDPADSSLINYTINGSSITYKGVKNTIDSVRQYYNPNASRNVTVTFNANGGSCSTSTKTVSPGSTVGTLPTPTRNGYEFAGWYPDLYAGSTPITSSTKVSSNVTYYAHWTSERNQDYHIVFNPNGGKLPDAYKTLVVDGQNTGRGSAVLMVYDCDGMTYKHNGIGFVAAVDSKGKMVDKREYGNSSDIAVPNGGFLLSAHSNSSACKILETLPDVVYAAYDESSGKVYLYDSENAYISYHKYMSPYDSYEKLPVPTREGYVFDGWFPDMGNEITWETSYMPSEVIARWVSVEDARPSVTMTSQNTGHLYERYDCIMTWEDAKEFCESRGGYLATITSAEEQKLIMDGLVSDPYRSQYFIGASDAAKEGTWTWVTGEPFAYNNWNQKVPEPSGGPSENDALIFATDELKNYTPGDWLDIANLDVNGIHSTCNTGFICEYDSYCDHQYKAVVTEGNCQTPGYTTYTCTECGDAYTVYDGEVSEWSTTKPTGVDEDRIETKTQYRYADKETKTSYEVLDDWKMVGSSWQNSGSGSIQYVKSWPAGFATSHSLYSTYNKSPKTASKDETNETKIDSDKITGYLYYHWCRGTHTSGPINRGSKSTKQGEYTAFHAFYSTTSPSSLTAASDGDGSYQYSNGSCCKDSYWYFYTPVYTQSYSTYRNQFSYERWGNWSDWADTEYSASGSRKVETRTLYRYTTANSNDHKYSGGYCSICGAVDPDYEFIPAVITPDDVSGYPGSTIKVPVMIEQNPGFSGFTFAINYDKTAMTLMNISKGEVLKISESASFTKNVNDGIITWSDIEDLTADGVLLELTFAISNSAEPGNYEICLALRDDREVNFANQNARPVPVEFECGTVAVGNAPKNYCVECSRYYTAITTEPTCTEDGYVTYTCAGCGDRYVEVNEDALGHSFTEYKSNKDATCTKDGTKTASCDNGCGKTHTVPDEGSVLGHKYGYKVSVQPTTASAGTLLGTCSQCKGTTSVELPKLNTTDYIYSVEKESSYTEAGIGRYAWKVTTYGTYYFDVTLEKLEATLTKIEIATNPTKTAYQIGEAFDASGLTLKATYSDGTTKTITTGFEVSGFSSSTAGTKTVTVSYQGKITSFAVTVKQVEVAPYAPQIVVSNTIGFVGKQVDVTISLRNNPGVASMMLTVGYNPDVLTLTSVNDKGNLGSAVHSDNLLACPYTLTWANDLAMENYTFNGEIVVLSFLVKEDAALGETPITIYYDYDNFDIFNVDGEEVRFALVDGVVNVLDTLIGDVNSDGKINTQDRMILTRYLAKWTGYTDEMIDFVAADVNCDAKVNTQDRMILTRYLAKMTGYETLPYNK